MFEWKDVLQQVGSTLGNDPESIVCVLEFLKVLPEEVTEGRKVTLSVRPPSPGLPMSRFPLSIPGGKRHDPLPEADVMLTDPVAQEEELSARTTELIEDNAMHVLRLLTRYAQSSGTSFAPDDA